MSINRVVLVTFIALSATQASCQSGPPLRKRAIDRECPSGNTCSERTPNGLLFEAKATYDTGQRFLPIAVGGTQTLTALVETADESPAILDAFEAMTTDPNVATIDEVKSPSIVVRGKSKGTAFLRLVEPRTGKLFDRVTLEVEPIAKVTLYPAELVFVNTEEAPWALFADSLQMVVVRIEDESGNRLVDEGIELKPPWGNVVRLSWDVFGIRTPPTTASFQIKAGDGSFFAKAEVVSTIDGITPATKVGKFEEPALISLKAPSFFCFVAWSGGAAVAGAEWSYTPTPNVHVITDGPSVPAFSNCAILKGLYGGPATLTVEASGFIRVFQFVVGSK